MASGKIISQTTDNILDKNIGWLQEGINQHLISAITDCNSFANTNFVTLTKFASNTPNAPTTDAGVILDFKYTTNSEVQLALVSGGTKIYVRKKSSGTWGSWTVVNDDSGWNYPISGSTVVRYRLLYGTVYISISNWTIPSDLDGTAIFTLPSEYRPSESYNFFVRRHDNSSVSNGWVSTGGAVNVASDAKGKAITMLISYPVG